MILKEFEAKELLTAAGLVVPRGIVVAKTAFNQDTLTQLASLNFPVFVKAQVLHGNRELEGLIKKVTDFSQLESTIKQIFSKLDRFNQAITSVLVEELIQAEAEFYLSFSYSTQTRSAVVQYSEAGGVGMDERGALVTTTPIKLTQEITQFEPNPALLKVVQQLFEVFKANDAVLVEINPLVKTDQGFVCLDAKLELDSAAHFRHPDWSKYGKRSQIAKQPTVVELKAKEISRMDTRGVAGESFFEFSDGNIGVMASGGGASVLAMDALLAQGLKPANYTEYSGNPTREKVAALAELVLKLPNLEALFVVGSNANFTDIYETLAGVVDALEKASLPKGFKVLIRRGGPRWQEAFEMVKRRLQDKDIELKLFGPDFPIVRTAVELKKMFVASKGSDGNFN